MALILTEEQMMLRDNARAFLADKAPVAHLRKLRDTRDADGFSRPLWKAFAEMGFCGLLLPESLGGSGLGYVEGGVIMEEIGRNLTPSPFLSTALLGATALLRDGNSARNKELLPSSPPATCFWRSPSTSARSTRPARPRSRRSAAATVSPLAARKLRGRRPRRRPFHRRGAQRRRAGRDRRPHALSRRRQGEGDRHRAHRDGRCPQCGAHPPRSRRGRRRCRDRRGRSRLAAARRRAQRGPRRGRRRAAGLGEEVFERTLGYLKQRRQFGQPIGEFQALQHRAAHLFTELEITQPRCSRRCRRSMEISIAPHRWFPSPRRGRERARRSRCRKACRCTAASA